VLKKTITYKDFNGQEVSEDFFFHLSKAELVELELSHEDGLSAALQRIVDAEDGKGIVQEFKNIILSAYGVRSADGKRFTKNSQIREEFESTEAYSELFIELVLNTDAAIEFINGIIPAGMAEEAAKLAAPDLKAVEEGVAVVPTPVMVTKAEMQNMNEVELRALGVKLSKGEVKLAE
jgi:hypothetical protein